MKLKNKIKSIIDALKDSDVNHIEISSFWGAQKIKMIKDVSTNKFTLTQNQSPPISQTAIHESEKEQVASTPLPNDSNVEEPKSVESDITIFKSPLVGTYYQSSKPGEPPFIEINQKVAKGQVVCIIEAMKIFNEIESEYTGQIVEILVNDGDPIEYDQPLFKIIES